MVRLAKSSGEYPCACVGAEAMALTHSSASDSTSDFRLMIVAPTSRVPFQSHHTSKPDVARRRIHRLSVARGRAVAAAVARRAEVRAALDHLAGYSDPRLASIVAGFLAPATRVLGDAAGLRRIRFVLRREPIGRPFPDVADHVEEAVTVRGISADRRRALVGVRRRVPVRELAGPRVRHLAPARHELVAPGELGLLEPAARRELPLGL